MTITVAPMRNEYTSTAGQTVFTYTFKIFEDTDLNVYVTPAGQTANDATDQVTPTLVTGVGNENGGTVTIAATSEGDRVTIVGDIPASRTTDYQNNGDFRPNVVNNDFDRVVSLVKQGEDLSNRSLVFQESQQGTQQLTLPAPQAGYLMRWNSGLTGLENVEVSTPVETTLNSVAALRNLPIADLAEGTAIFLNGYYTDGDGGGGPRRILFKSGGPYVDNGGSIIVPTAITDGSAAWLFSEKVNEYDFRWFGARGVATDDTTSIDNTLSALSTINGTLKQSPGVFGYAGSLDVPDRINIVGSGAAQIATFPQTGGEKSLLRPGFKDQISGTAILFLSVDSTYTTNRSDRYASMTYCMSFTPANSSYRMKDIAIIQDMDVLDAGGSLTTSSTDNRANIDAGLITNSTGATHSNVTIFGYFNDAGLVIHNDLTTPSLDPDYNTFMDCNISGGTVIIGSDTAGGAIAEGNTGQRFIGCGLYAADHHTRADGDYTIPAIYIDGYLSSSAGGIRGHSFVGSNIRTYANDAIVLDHADDIQFTSCVTEFPLLSGITNADALGGFVGTANTKAFRAFGLASTHSQKMETFVSQITGPFQIVGAGAFDHAIFGQDGSGVRLLGSGNDSTIQLTSDFTSTVSDWLIQRDGDSSDLLAIKYDNTIVSSIDSSGGMRWGGMGVSSGNLTLSSGSITLGSANNIAVVTEGGASTDDLDTILGGKYDGEMLIVRAFSSANTVVVTENGNIRLNSAGNFSLDNAQDRIMLIYDGDNWIELSRSDNTA